MRQRKSKKSNEEHVKTDRYLITYADLITLLLGLFVILYAASQVDDEKYKELKNALNSYFSSPDDKPLSGGEGVLDGYKGNIPDPILSRKESKSLDEITRNAEESLKEMIADSTIVLTRSDKELKLTLSENLIFESGKAEVRSEGAPVLDTLSAILQGIEYQITVDGHTDSAPIRTFRYESNWHLSVARATNVAYSIIRKGVAEHNIVIRGFGAQRPISENISDSGRARNRRVEITIAEQPVDALSTQGYIPEDSLAD